MKIISLGGYSEVGMNMTALIVGDEAVIFDMGLYMPKIVGFDDEIRNFRRKEMIEVGAIPDDTFIEKYRDKVKAIVISHAHLDHVGAVPYLASKYDAPVVGSPYTIEILKRISEDKNLKFHNELKSLGVNGKLKVSENITIDFVNVTHSTLQCVIIAVHTPEGTVVYANDFKLDNHPTLGKPPNYEKLKSFKNVRCLIANGLYSRADRKTPSERVAREMLKDVLFSIDGQGKAIFVTSFASHIARLKSIAEFGKKINRKVVFLGRSLHKYVDAAKKLGLVDFPDVEIIGYSSKVKKKLSMIQKGRRDKYLVVTTGNQAEPGSVLDRVVNGAFKFNAGDNVIFSCKTIPVDPNIQNRENMEAKLKKKKVRIFTEIHASGHGSREDLRELFELVKPEHIIPTHASNEVVKPMVELAVEMGYKEGKTVHYMNDKKILEI